MTFEEKVRQLTLKAMFINDTLLDRIVFKGGNALDIVYSITGRASLDLDFSINDDFSEEEIPKIVETIDKSLGKMFEPEGLKTFDLKLHKKPEINKPGTEDFWGGYIIEFKVTDKKSFEKNGINLEKLRREAKVIGPGNVKKFEIDISKYEYCNGKKLAEYDGYNIYVYTLEMIVFEKLRAICQQTEEYRNIIITNRKPRARDFFDIYKIQCKSKLKLYNTENIELLKSFFDCKKVPLHYLSLIKNYREFHFMGYELLKSTVTGENIKPFDFYFDYVLEIVENFQLSIDL